MKKAALASAILAGAMALAVPARANGQEPQGYTMPSTQVWDMTADSGEVYRIFVSYPAADVVPPEGGFPVLTVLDANALFAGFAEARRIQEGTAIGKAIVVGVGYPTDKPYDLRRIYDLTGGPPPPPYDVKLGEVRSGGWEKFLDFLTGKLRNEIARRFKVNPERQALFGHSLGGLLATHALFTRPGVYHAIIAASPSLFWQQEQMLQEERTFTKRLQAGQVAKVSRLMIVAGERDETDAERFDPEALAKRMEPLSAYGLRTQFHLYAGEVHISVPSRSVTDTLRFVSAWP